MENENLYFFLVFTLILPLIKTKTEERKTKTSMSVQSRFWSQIIIIIILCFTHVFNDKVAFFPWILNKIIVCPVCVCLVIKGNDLSDMECQCKNHFGICLVWIESIFFNDSIQISRKIFILRDNIKEERRTLTKPE